MAVSHAKSNTVADFTGTVTVYNSAGATTTVAATDLIRPSDWNSGHNQYYTLAGNTNNASTVSAQNVVLSGGNNVTLIGSNSSIGFSVGNYITTGALSDHSHGNPSLNLTHLAGTTGSNSAGLSLSLALNTFPASLATVSSLAGASYTNLQSIHDLTRAAGHLDGGAITDAGGGSVNVAAGSGFIRATGDDTSTLLTFNWPAPSALAVPSDTIRYVVVEYNAGTPQVVLYTSESYDYRTAFPLGVVVNEGGTLYINDTPHSMGRSPGRIARRNYEVDGRSRANALGGLIISESGTAKTVAVTSGVTWWRGLRETFAAFDSNAAGRFDRYYRNGGGGWTREATQSLIPDGLWDNNSGTLQTITNNNFANYWFYLGPAGGVVMVYGRANHNSLALAAAEASPASLPLRLQVGGILLGRFTIQRSGASYTVVQTDSAFQFEFIPSPASDHGALGGLADNDHPQYALSEHSHGNPQLNLTNLSGTTASNSAGFTLSLSAAAPGGGGAVNVSAGTTSGDLQTIQFNNANNVSFGLNGSTVTASVAPAGGVTLSYFNPQDGYMQVTGLQGQGTLHVQPAQFPDVQCDRICFPMYHSGASNSTLTVSVTMAVGFYTRNGASISLQNSTSTSFSIDHSGTVNSANFLGIRLATIPYTDTIEASQYWVGIVSRTSTAGANATVGQVLASQMNTNFSGVMGVASNATMQYTRGLGHYSASTLIPPNAIGFSEIRGTNSSVLRQPLFYVVSGTV